MQRFYSLAQITFKLIKDSVVIHETTPSNEFLHNKDKVKRYHSIPAEAEKHKDYIQRAIVIGS